MSNHFFKSVAITGLTLALIVALGAIFMGQWKWAAGILAGACWIFINLFFLFQLLEIGMTARVPRKKDKILLISILKFPVLYIAGFFILKSRFFPTTSILLGLTLFMFALTVFWMRANRLDKSFGKTIS